MATYTLSYTGAEVNSAIGNAKDLFSTVHTWTATQTFGDLTSTGSLTAFSADLTTGNVGTLTVTTNMTVNAPAMFSGNVVCTGDLTISSLASFNCAGSATFNTGPSITGDTDIDGDLIISDELYVSGPSTFATITGTDITGSRIESTNDVIVGRSIRINSDKVTISFETSAGTMPTDGVYISINGMIVANEGDPYPANVLLIVFDY